MSTKQRSKPYATTALSLPKVRQLCSAEPRVPVPLAPAVVGDPRRARAIISVRNKWVNRTVLHYCFFQGNSPYKVPKNQADAVRQAFTTWKQAGIGLEFEEVDQLSEAEVRIGYSTAIGRSQSAVGRDVLRVPLNEPTTLYGWDLTSPYGRGTALHELGHVLGMEHEHQNPFAGIKWHEDAVYAALAQPPNEWDRATTYHNILEKLDTNEVQGSQWDPDSIMEYEFGPGLIDEPEQYDVNGLIPPGTLSQADKAWALKWYPGDAPQPTALTPFQLVPVQLAIGQQVDFIFKPPSSRKFTIVTQGASDTLLALFEEVNGVPRYLAADDDSGEERNARIVQKLFRNRTYHIRLRLYYPGQSGTTAIIVT